MIVSAIVVAFFLAAAGPPSANAAIVSLGDSYSSGEGAGPFDSETKTKIGSGCHRSSKAWPRLLGVPKRNHFACSGAKTDNFFVGQKTDLRGGADIFPQLDRLSYLASQEVVSKVYVTIGGNDLGFGSIIRSCRLGPSPPRHCLTDLEGKDFPKLKNEVLPNVRFSLIAAKQASNNADVILVGYPDVIPRGMLHNCGWIDDGEHSRLLWLQSKLNSTLRKAADDAGVAYVPIRDALEDHELCRKDSWVFPVTSPSAAIGFQQQGHPNAEGQKAIARAVRRAEDSGAGVVPAPPINCTPSSQVATIIDDSSSMEDTDPDRIRVSAMQLLITKPSGLLRTVSAVEFGTRASALFTPSLIAFSKDSMLAALSALQDDGVDGESATNYNEAFTGSSYLHPAATSRIFFTDGEHNVDDYLDVHVGGPRTYVVGLGIGPSGEGNDDADLLRRIAAETGGEYFPLLRGSEENVSTQVKRIQPLFNAIDALLQCRTAPKQSFRTVSRKGKPSRPVSAPYVGDEALEVVASWNDPDARITLGSIAVTGGRGKVFASLTGKTPRKGKKRGFRKVPKLEVSQATGIAYVTAKVPRPPKGSHLKVSVKATSLPGPTSVNVQIGPVSEETVPAPPVVPNPPTPPAPTIFVQQVTPKRPVNTFLNYHNASGVGPQIPAGTWVEVSCRVYDPFIGTANPDGWWYRIQSPPWNNSYYSPANVFMNGDPYGGPYLHNTDFAVPVC